MKKTFYKFLVAIVAAVSLSGLQLLAVINFSQKILWQVNTMLWFVGPGPLLGYDSNGKPLYEGTPVHLVAGIFGLLFGVVVYAVIIYILINRKWAISVPAK